MTEQNENRSKGVVLSFRPALTPPPLGNDESFFIGQASSDLIAKLGNKSKVGFTGPNHQPPSKTTLGGENNVIYLNLTSRQNLCPTRQSDEIKNSNEKDNSNGLSYIFE